MLDKLMKKQIEVLVEQDKQRELREICLFHKTKRSEKCSSCAGYNLKCDDYHISDYLKRNSSNDI